MISRHVPMLAALALLGASFGGPADAAQAPKVSITALSQLSTPLPFPYDEKADANAAVDAAFARAKKSGKRVFIDMGGNWCGDCRVLAGLMELPEVKSFIDAHYEVVTVDVGRFDKNLQIPARFGITTRLEGVPAVIVADADGTFIDKGHITALADARHMDPQSIVDWLAQWAK
jgi:thiol-disulfide isomerase/thioredoxin